ncbi:alpha-N-arabinofuranosidase [Amphibacillus marinus]|uniref:Alpha-N-arabinofuranosidase n=1 Tax=Amphibacillus marinus TaxID=872970 RepID=A0A1H8HAI3_9BACI|nr:glycoside hydrolase family 43 protein [Amphibacillus marinus]SEN53206.1 alpha-N-arabinofuranosidase [Amphibacillus marinus]
MKTFKNPILPGFYPDPSVCRVEDDYYLVTSTFEYYPGVPIFHSKDLVNWRQLGHVLDRPDQLDLDYTPASRGIYAPTIRYHQGLFYMITTFVVSQTGERRNFYVTSSDPAGQWSDPIWLPDAPGIDPSLFFDDDGRVYYTGNRMPPNGPDYHKHNEIWLQELDIQAGKLIGEKYSLWDGALKNAHAQESPHLYKRGEYYYLMIAEGGTGFTHAVTIARSPSVKGPYEAAKINPILTHRHLGKDYPITNVGHADLIETQIGEWWLVCLASRPYGGPYRNLGRETFLTPVNWEDNWPVVNPGKGIIEMETRFPHLPEWRWQEQPNCDHFNSERLNAYWNFIRTPRGEFWSLSERQGFLRLKAKPVKLTEENNPAFIGRRQQHISFLAQTVMDFQPTQDDEAAGLALLQNHDYQFRFEYRQFAGEPFLQLIHREAGEEQVIAKTPLSTKRLYLRVTANQQSYTFSYSVDDVNWQCLAEKVSGTILSTDVAGGFVGAYLGMFISSNGFESSNRADFDCFEYQGLD